jgi:hypothetical protein
MIQSWAPLTPHCFSIQLEWRWAERITILNFFKMAVRRSSSHAISGEGCALALSIGIAKTPDWQHRIGAYCNNEGRAADKDNAATGPIGLVPLADVGDSTPVI